MNKLEKAKAFALAFWENETVEKIMKEIGLNIGLNKEEVLLIKKHLKENTEHTNKAIFEGLKELDDMKIGETSERGGDV